MCCGVNAHLVTIDSQAENDVVLTLQGSAQYSWFGLDDLAVEDNFQGITGEPLTFSLLGNPGTNTIRNCVYLSKNTFPWSWVTTNCFWTGSHVTFVVEYECPFD